MRSRIGDEAAFLADQAVHIGRVQSDLSAAGDHAVAKRHGKTLLGVDDRLGAFAGVDAAVPHLALAGQVGGGQQLAVGHATGVVQGNGVVPFAHALAAQAQRDGGQGALQARVALRVGAFGRVQGRWGGGGGDALAQRFERQLLVKAPRRCDALPQRVGLCGLAALVQGARLPIDPGGIALLFAGQGGKGLQQHRPVGRTQRGAGLPQQVFGVHVLVLAALEIGQRVGLALLRG